MNKFYSLLWYFSNSQDNLHRFYRKYYPVRHSKPLNHTTNVHWKAEIGTSKKQDKCLYKCFKNPDSWVQGSLRRQRERTLLDIKTLACTMPAEASWEWKACAKGTVLQPPSDWNPDLTLDHTDYLMRTTAFIYRECHWCYSKHCLTTGC